MPVNTTALKTFAPAMRRQLLEAVGRKLDLLLHSQTPDTLSTYAKQIAELREQDADNREQLLERVAYTWFNRLCALRYLDARSWHPFGCKVLMPAGEGETQPEVLKLMRAGSLPVELKPHTNEARLHGLLDGQIPPAIAGADPQGEVYRELVLASCRSYHRLLPDVFEQADDYTELLLPDEILSENSIVAAFREKVSDEDCDDVEALGWLYQFYISERKDNAMAKKKSVEPRDIPAVTQLFTPHWIVRFLVENSIGRLWLRSRPESKLREHMPFFVNSEDSNSETDLTIVSSPEDIRVLDPACGSGHILTYAFDLLALIYKEEGYSQNEIANKILGNNLYGLEICPRAAQLAQIALLCKAREYSRAAFRGNLHPSVHCLRDYKLDLGDLDHLGDATSTALNCDEIAQLHQFRENMSIYGSLAKPVLDTLSLQRLQEKIQGSLSTDNPYKANIQNQSLLAVEQAQYLVNRYNVVIANPPYMGGNAMNTTLATMAGEKFPDSKNDMYALFIERGLGFLSGNGILAMITMQGWMFLRSFESLRRKIIANSHISTFLQIGYNTFPELNSKVALGCAFVLNNAPSEAPGAFINLNEASQSANKEDVFMQSLANNSVYTRNPRSFTRIPGAPFAYWLSDRITQAFESNPTIGSCARAAKGLATGDNGRFVRLWTEVNFSGIGFGLTRKEAAASGKKWFPYSNGGELRRWYGNLDSCVNWENDGHLLQTELTSDGKRVRATNLNLERIFKSGIVWTSVTTSDPSFRVVPKGFLFDAASGVLQSGEKDSDGLLGLLNSVVARRILAALNPTINLSPGYLESIPYPGAIRTSEYSMAVKEMVYLAKADWDYFETSWDFERAPLIVYCAKHSRGERDQQINLNTNIASCWSESAQSRDRMIERLRSLEEYNNSVWIKAFGLEDELGGDVQRDEITLFRPSARTDSQCFVSYAVGCMMGRYSLEQPGLILADSRDNQAAHLAAYEEKVGKPLGQVQFKPDADAIIPVLDGEWFEDDIVARTREFLEVTFPESTVTENLRFIEESLGKDIRKYFCSEFYKDHLQTYKKRPIYWMVQSPKKGFACLIYLHRYTKDTLNQVLNNYFRPYLQKLEARLAQLGLDQLNDSLPTRERTAARKEADKITKLLKECQAWEQDALLPLAQQRIELDLDDGVKVNYLKLQDVLAPIPGLAAKED
jgi:hypothetical protein